MATPNIVPRADQEGGLGTAAKSWGKLFIENAAAGGTAAATISNLDIDQIALDINALNTTANVLDITATAVTSGNVINIDANSLSGGSAIYIDVDDALTTDNSKILLNLDYDKSSNIGNTESGVTKGLGINLADAGTNIGSMDMVGIEIDIDSASAGGTIRQKGIDLKVAADGFGDAATTFGIEMEVMDGGTDMKMMSSVDTGDFFSIATTTHGATTLTTVDDDAAAAHFEIAADGNIVLDSAALINVESTGLTKFTSGAGVEIENTSTSPALLIDNDTVGQVALDIDAANTTANVIDVVASGLNGGAGLFLNTRDANAKDIQIVSSADTGDYFSIGTVANGATLLTTVDDDGSDAHLTLAADGNIVQNAEGIWDINATGAATIDAASMDMNVGSGTLELTTTGALDINSGAATVDTAALTVTHSALAKFMTTGGVEIENNASSGAAALTIDNNDVDKIALDIDAANTTANIIDIDATALTSGKAIHIDAANGGQALIHIDKDDTSTGSVNGSNGLLNVDYLKTGATGNGDNVTASSINIVHKDNATNHSGSTVALTAIKAEVDFANSTGTTSATGLDLTVTDASVNTGIDLTCEDGGTDLIIRSSADEGDNFSIVTNAHGATTLKTTDDDAAAAHIIFEADGNVDVNGLTITLDAATGIELEAATNVTGDLDVSAEATVASLICTAGGTFGGGFGSTGTTISTAGVGQFDGALTTGAALTADNIVCTNAATFGGGTGSTGVTISTAGVVTADGAISSTASGVTGLNYRTIWIDAGSMVPQVTNGAAAGTSESADAYDVMNDYFAFDASTIEFTQYKLAMPLQWNGGTIKAKFYWKPASSTTTSHSVMWGIDGQAHADGGELGAWGTTVNVAIDDVIATDSPKKVHVSAASGAVTIAGSPAAGASELVYLRFQRVANHATDDLNEDAHLLGVAIQYQETAALQAAW